MSFEIIPPGTNVDFLGQRRICIAVSIAVIALGAVFASVNGVKVGLDFAGGTEVQLLFADGVEVDEGLIRSVVADVGFADSQVVRFGDEGDSEFNIKFNSVVPGSRRRSP